MEWFWVVALVTYFVVLAVGAAIFVMCNGWSPMGAVKKDSWIGGFIFLAIWPVWLPFFLAHLVQEAFRRK